jgi:hypothetical protein
MGTVIHMSSLTPPLPRNPETARLHRRDLAWQIYLPIGLAVLALLVVGGLAIWAAVSGQAAVDSVWADVSLIFLILMTAALALLPLAAAAIFGLWFALRYLPGYARVAQEYVALAAGYVRQAADRAVQPFIAVDRAAAAVSGGWKAATERKPKE